MQINGKFIALELCCPQKENGAFLSYRVCMLPYLASLLSFSVVLASGESRDTPSHLRPQLSHDQDPTEDYFGVSAAAGRTQMGVTTLGELAIVQDSRHPQGTRADQGLQPLLVFSQIANVPVRIKAHLQLRMCKT